MIDFKIGDVVKIKDTFHTNTFHGSEGRIIEVRTDDQYRVEFFKTQHIDWLSVDVWWFYSRDLEYSMNDELLKLKNHYKKIKGDTIC